MPVEDIRAAAYCGAFASSQRAISFARAASSKSAIQELICNGGSDEVGDDEVEEDEGKNGAAAVDGGDTAADNNGDDVWLYRCMI